MRKHPTAATVLKTYMDDLNITAVALAKHIHVEEPLIQDFLDEKLDLTVDLAIRFGITFGNGAHYWMNIAFHSKLQSYDYNNIKSLWTE